ncbi:MAG: hypothetical protein ACYCO9_00175 [Streptosporangiaceae bacterium]
MADERFFDLLAPAKTILTSTLAGSGELLAELQTLDYSEPSGAGNRTAAAGHAVPPRLIREFRTSSSLKLIV